MFADGLSYGHAVYEGFLLGTGDGETKLTTRSDFSRSLVNVDDLRKYFGFPAKNHEFSEFLLKIGINENPAFDLESGNPFYIIQLPELGLSLEFIRPFAFIKKFGPIREDAMSMR